MFCSENFSFCHKFFFLFTLCCCFELSAILRVLYGNDKIFVFFLQDSSQRLKFFLGNETIFKLISTCLFSIFFRTFFRHFPEILSLLFTSFFPLFLILRLHASKVFVLNFFFFLLFFCRKLGKENQNKRKKNVKNFFHQKIERQDLIIAGKRHTETGICAEAPCLNCDSEKQKKFLRVV